MKSESFTYPVTLTPAEEGGFTVTFPDVPGAITEGDGETEALRHAVGALETMFIAYTMDKQDIPRPSPRGNGRRWRWRRSPRRRLRSTARCASTGSASRRWRGGSASTRRKSIAYSIFATARGSTSSPTRCARSGASSSSASGMRRRRSAPQIAFTPAAPPHPSVLGRLRTGPSLSAPAGRRGVGVQARGATA